MYNTTVSPFKICVHNDQPIKIIFSYRNLSDKGPTQSIMNNIFQWMQNTIALCYIVVKQQQTLIGQLLLLFSAYMASALQPN